MLTPSSTRPWVHDPSGRPAHKISRTHVVPRVARAFALAAIALCVAAATSFAGVPSNYTISATAGSGGTVSPPGDTQVPGGGDLTIDVEPADCWAVADVLVDGVSVGAVTQYTFDNVMGSHTLHATFHVPTFILNGTCGGDGTIVPAGDVTQNCGEQRTFYVIPNDCYQVADVLVDGVSVGAVTQYTFSDIRAAHTVYATFSRIPYSIDVTTGSGGAVAPNGTFAANCGDDVSFTITPDPCHHIADVTVDGVSIGAQSSFTLYNVRADHSLEATFAIDQYTINTSAGTNGSISPSGAVTVDCGSDQAFTIDADACHRVTDVEVDGVSVGAVTAYTFTNVQAGHTLNATFQIRTHDVTATAGAGGSISPSGHGIYPCGTDPVYTITPHPCGSVADVVVDGVSVGAVTSYTFTGIAADHTIDATFQSGYTVTATAGAGGSVSPAGTTLVACHADQAVTITADACHAVADVVVDGVSVGATGSYTFTDVTAAHTLAATFVSTAQATSTAVSANPPSPTSCMHPVTLSATVTPSNATGSVEFFADGQSLGSAPVVSGTASMNPEPPETGSYTLHAVYTPSGCFAPSTSPNVTYEVLQATPVVTLSSNANPSTWTGNVTLTVTVNSPTATGTVTFKDSTTTIGTAVLSNGSCSIQKSNFTPGGHSLSATYSGNACYATVPSNFLRQYVSRAASTVALSGNQNPVEFGQVLALTAQVTPTGATGRVTFYDGGSPIGTAAVNALTGAATLSVSNLSPGTHDLTASYPGDAKYTPSTTAAAVQELVQQATSTVALGFSPASPVCGQDVTVTASVGAPDATGTVEFFEGGQSLGSVNVLNGVGTLTDGFAVGAHDLTATYSGDGYHAAASSPIGQVTVGTVPVTVTLTGSANPSTWTQAVTLTATVSPANATGTITFKDSVSTLGTATLSGGSAHITVSNLQPGRHGAITAQYAGDGCMGAGVSAPHSQLVARAWTSTMIAANTSPITFGQTVALTATVSPSGGTNRVQFYSDGNPVGSAAVNALTGVATLNVSNLAPGMHMMTASYNGDAKYTNSATPYGTAVLVDRAVVQGVVAITPASPSCGEAVTLTATLDDPSAGGTVEFFDGASSLGTATVTAGVATHSVALAAGAHTITANYSGDGFFEAVAPPAASVTVTQAVPSVQLTSSQASQAYGQPVTFDVTVSPWTATGSVTFYDSLTVLGTVALVNGTASLSKSNLPVGVHTAIRAAYAGDGCYSAVSSSAWQQTVSRAATTVQLVSDLNPSVYAQVVKLSAVVTPAGGTNRVTFYDNGNLIGSANVDALTGVAVLNVSTLMPGAHTLTASYAGDRNYAGAATASNLVQDIDQAPASLTLVSDVQTAMCGQIITMTATVSPGDACGSVEFFKDGVSLGSSPVQTGGIAMYTVKEFTPGSYSMTAEFSGCVAYSTAQSQPYVQALIPNPTPDVAVGSPNGGEVLTLGAHATLAWNATDNTEVVSVKLELSRDNGANWETIVASTPNSGSYDWVVTGPGTNTGGSQVYAALLRVIATDDFEGQGVDVSNQPFALYDPLVPVVITELVAQPVDGGIRVRWALRDGGVFSSVTLERAATAAGPWAAVNAELSTQSDATVATDCDVQPGQTYWYRLVGTTAGGQQAVYGPVSGTAAAPREFALSAVWPNPTRGPLSMVFTVPRGANVRLAVVDLQGRDVAVLADGAFHAGRFQVSWDGRTDRGPVPAGLYFVRFTSPDRTITNRVAIAR